MTADSERAVTVTRHFGLDWLRIAAFGTLILFHIGKFFAPGPWLVKTPDPIEWTAWPLLAVQPWRLALLFLVSGYASRALLAKLGGNGAFTIDRTKRLIIPLLFGIAAIVPPQSWVVARIRNGYPADFWHFWTHDYFRFGLFNGRPLPEWQHLWFIFYLWFYTMMLIMIWSLIGPALKARLAGWFDWLGGGSRLLWLPLLYFVPARIGVVFTFGESPQLIDNWVSHLIYLPCFLFGFMLAATDALQPAIARLWKPAAVIALACYAVLLAVVIAYPDDGIWPPHWLMALDRAAMGTMTWSMMIVVLRLADTLLARDHRWRLTLSRAVFPFYIIHQTTIVIVGWWLLSTDLGPAAQFAVLLAATAASCWGFYWLGRVTPLGPLMGLSRRHSAATGRPPGADADPVNRPAADETSPATGSPRSAR